MVTGNDLVRRRPGQRGCCGCGFAMLAGLSAMLGAALFTRARLMGRAK